MSSDSQESEIKQFYEEASLSSERIDAILSQGEAVVSARFWKRLAIGSCVGCVAMLILCTLLWVRLQELSQGVQLAEGASDSPASDQLGPSLEPAGPGVSQLQAPIRLVAVKNHGDRCPHCRATGEVFADLRQKLQGRPISFELIDLKSPDDPEKLDHRLEELRLSELIEGRREKGLLALADATGQVRELDVSVGSEQLEQEIVRFFENE